jgi:hypothetical protein
MKLRNWTRTLAAKRRRLVKLGNLTPECSRHPALRAIATLCLAAAADIECRQIPNSVGADMRIPGYAEPNDAMLKNLLAEIAASIQARLQGSSHGWFNPVHWLQEFGLDEFVRLSIEADHADEPRRALLTEAAQAARQLHDRIISLSSQHGTAVMTRDLPELVQDWEELPPAGIAWLLVHDHDGDASRPQRITRRFQALSLFASVREILREDSITDAIDTGQELLPMLANRLCLTPPELRALRQAAPMVRPSAFMGSNDYLAALAHLRAHQVPLHEWPGNGRPGQQAAWTASPWLQYAAPILVRADYHPAEPVQVRDAVSAFEEDLLNPLIRSLSGGDTDMDSLRSNLTLVRNCMARTGAPNFEATLPLAQRFLTCIGHALIGPRGPKAFQEAVELWHRRVACIAALRAERQADRPGWPPLCASWTSPCGVYSLVPLTTAAALVDKGNAHQHCVGTYYDTCRRGDTQILSLRANGDPAATVEILLGSNFKRPSLRIGQFKGWHDETPEDPHLHDALRDFLQAVRTGAHPLNLRELAAYRRWAAENYEYHSSTTLPLEHARAVFPLYRGLLPRGTPDDYDAWCQSSGLRDGIASVLDALAARDDRLARAA